MSRNTRSGGGVVRRSSSTASRPLEHSSMCVTLLICCSTPRSLRRAGASSSTMIARMIGVGNVDHGQGAAGGGGGGVGQLEAMTRTVQLLQTGPCVGESQSSAAGAAVEARPVVTHLEMQAVALPDRGDRNLRDVAVGDDAVSDRVLHKRLQEQGRDDGGCGPGIDAKCHAQTIAESRFLDGDVMVQQLEFLLECDERTPFPVKGLPQQLGQAPDHPVRLLGILEDECRNGVQRVEEEMRLELSHERIEPRLYELRLESSGAPGVIQPGDHRVDERIELQPDP